MSAHEPEPTGGVSVGVLQPGDDAGAWDAWVQASPAATFFHLSTWTRTVERTLGHRAHLLFASDAGGAIRGVLPLANVKSRLFGNALISVPFAVYGGIAADTPEAAAVLDDAAASLARDLGVDYLELRHREARDTQAHVDDLYVTFRKAIPGDAEANLKSIPRKQRAMVRKGIQAGLEYRIDDGVDTFYDMYSESVRNLGTPVLPKAWYAALHEAFGDACDVLTVTHEGRAVCSVLSFYFRDEVLPFYGGGGADARALKANDFMYYALMNHAAERGCRVFDYGRSKEGAGSYSFKKNWGFEPEPLHYEHHLVRASDPPALNPNNPKYRLAISVWQKLPLPVTRMVGPMVAKYLA